MRLFVFDMDNTLIPRGEHDIHSASIDALSKLLLQGDAVCFASGRPFCSLQYHLRQLPSGKKFAIVANGAALMDQEGNVISASLFPMDDFYEIAASYQSDTVTVYAYDTDSGLVIFREDEWTDLEIFLNGIPKSDFHFADLKKKDAHFSLLKTMIAARPEISERIVFPPDYYEKYSISRSDPAFLEILPKGVDKGNRVEALRQYLGISRGDVYTFGDGDNDACMLLPYCGVAMGNAMDSAKKAAKYLTKDVKEEGVSYALKEILHVVD